MNTLGLDVSTTYVGVALLKNDGTILNLDHIDFKKCITLWDKADKVRGYLEGKREQHPEWQQVSALYVEDAAKKFAKGKTSADTIATLLRFNGLCSYLARSVLGIDPVFIAPTSARKLCGLKMIPKQKCGKSHKEQTYDLLMASDLKHITWPLKLRSVNVVDWSYDIVDAYCVCKAGLKMNKLK
jgi:hypothetical protein